MQRNFAKSVSLKVETFSTVKHTAVGKVYNSIQNIEKPIVEDKCGRLEIESNSRSFILSTWKMFYLKIHKNYVC